MQETTDTAASTSFGADRHYGDPHLPNLPPPSGPTFPMTTLQQPGIAASLPEHEVDTVNLSSSSFQPPSTTAALLAVGTQTSLAANITAGPPTLLELVQQASALAVLPAIGGLGGPVDNLEDLNFAFPDTHLNSISGADLANGTVAFKSELKPEDYRNLTAADALGDALSPDAVATQLSQSISMSSSSRPELAYSRIDPSSLSEPEPRRVRAFAKLEFEDGQFYMNTYALYIGRDLHLANQAKREAKQLAKRSSSAGDASQDASRIGPDGSATASRSLASETDGHGYLRRGKVKKAKSLGPFSRRASRRNSADFQPKPRNYQALASQTISNRDLKTLSGVQDPELSRNECPLVPIKPPIGVRHTFISRRHATIAYNAESHTFDISVHGRNGAFHGSTWLAPGDSQALHDNSIIQIAGVTIRFRLPQVDRGAAKDDSEELGTSDGVAQSEAEDDQSESDEKVNTDDDSDEDHAVKRAGKRKKPTKRTYDSGADSEETSDSDADDARPSIEVPDDTLPPARVSRARKNRKAPVKISKLRLKVQPKVVPKSTMKLKVKVKDKTKSRLQEENRQVKDPPGTKGSKEQKPVAEEKTEEKTPPAPVLNIPGLPPGFVPPPRRRGPGRPPKDGIMSKREKALIARQLREAEKARKLGIDPAELPPPTLKSYGEKKKPAKKKDVEMQDDQGYISLCDLSDEAHPGRSDNGDVNGAGSSSKPANGDPSTEASDRPPQPVRSPSPVMNEADYTEEQLQRPVANYVVLIHEAITNSATREMNLQQIYHAIERRYPYYRFKVSTTGWQSSVRHNLQQNDAFIKVRREGKGYIWGVNPNATIEKEKRKRAASPPARQYYTGPPLMHPPVPYHTMPGHGPAGYQGHPTQYGPVTTPLPPLYGAPSTSATYSSPYAPVRQPSAPVAGPVPNTAQHLPSASGAVPSAQSTSQSQTTASTSTHQGNQQHHAVGPSEKAMPNASAKQSQSGDKDASRLPALPREQLIGALTEFRKMYLESNAQAAMYEPNIDPIIRRFTHPELHPEPPKKTEEAIVRIIAGMLENMRKDHYAKNPPELDGNQHHYTEPGAQLDEESPATKQAAKTAPEDSKQANTSANSVNATSPPPRSNSPPSYGSEPGKDKAPESGEHPQVESSLMASLASAAAQPSSTLVKTASPSRVDSAPPSTTSAPAPPSSSELSPVDSQSPGDGEIPDQTRGVKRALDEDSPRATEPPSATPWRSKRLKREHPRHQDQDM